MTDLRPPIITIDDLKAGIDPIGTIICGDCLEAMPLLPKVDLVLTDPPYGVGKAEWDVEYFTGWEQKALSLSSKGVVANTGTKALPVAITAFGSGYKDLFYAWNKNGMTRSSIGFMNVLIAVVAGKAQMGQNFAQFVVKASDDIPHPSPKPIEYVQCLITRFSEKNDSILDPFLGSGTTAVACEQLGRKWIGIEINRDYCEIAAKRVYQERRQRKLPGIGIQ